MTIPDPVALLKEMLEDDAGVAALAAGRVFGGGLPPDEVSSMPRAAVVVSPAGGPGRRSTEGWRRNRIDTSCYGATVYQSWQLHLAVREALETLGRTGAIFTVQVVSDGAAGIDPVEQWPVTYATYMVRSATAA